MCKLLKYLNPFKFISTYLVIICIVTVIIFFLTWHFSIPTKLDNATREIDAWFYFLSGAGTAALAVIAWLKVGHIDKQNEGNFLLHIDERWGSRQSIKARVMIHKLYLQVQKDNQKLLGVLSPECRESSIQSKIGEKIISMSEDPKMEEDFIYLLNFLDFMETIGYLASENQVEHRQLDALCGESLMFNYKIFQPYIKHKREKHGQDGFYKNFEKLYEDLLGLYESQSKK